MMHSAMLSWSAQPGVISFTHSLLHTDYKSLPGLDMIKKNKTLNQRLVCMHH